MVREGKPGTISGMAAPLWRGFLDSSLVTDLIEAPLSSSERRDTKRACIPFEKSWAHIPISHTLPSTVSQAQLYFVRIFASYE